MIRIVAGELKGKNIPVLPGLAIRPTANKTRKAIFDVLENLLHWEDWVVYDLFAGSGALGIEALSRGAARVIFVELDAEAVKSLKNTLNSLPPRLQRFEIIHSDAQLWLARLAVPANQCLFFLDPPYAANYYSLILQRIAQNTEIRLDSLVIVERDRGQVLPQFPQLNLLKTKSYGQSAVDFLVKIKIAEQVL